jgi:hypothetical protein
MLGIQAKDSWHGLSRIVELTATAQAVRRRELWSGTSGIPGVEQA